MPAFSSPMVRFGRILILRLSVATTPRLWTGTRVCVTSVYRIGSFADGF